MRGIHLVRGDKYPKHPNTIFKKAKEVEFESVEHSLQFISNYTLEENKICLVYAMGGQPLFVLNELRAIQGIDALVIERYLVGNILHKLLTAFFNAYHGLFEVHDMTKLNDIFVPLISGWMAGIIIVEKNYKGLIIDSVRTNRNSNKVRALTEQDAGYFLYQVDGGNFESSTGIVEIISYGKNCSKELRDNWL